ncbi:MAG: elongation factor G [Rubrimonas sp.]|uniref:elongation factor G n=1 Tax=Rubrimonas sp. TaxID=2036015 RepID=UPI002FDE919A
MARCFAVLGPSGSGKSTLVDALAGGGGAKRDGELRVARFTDHDEAWTAIDCPGAIEFIGEAQSALLAADAAVVVVSPHPEHAVLAAPWLRAVEESETPAILFVNRMDEAAAQASETIAALQDYARHVLILRQIPIRKDGEVVGAVDLVSERAWRYREGAPSALVPMPAEVEAREHEAHEALLETLSEFDDWLLEEIVEERAPEGSAVYQVCARMLRENTAFPALIGSGLHRNGLVRLMKALRHEAPGVEALRARLAGGGAAPSAAAFHASHRKHVGKVTLVRALTEGLRPGASLGGGAVGALLDPTSDKAAAMDAAEPGAVTAAVKADHLAPCKLYDAQGALDAPAWSRPPAPMIARALTPANARDDVKLSTALAALGQDDPSAHVAQDPETGAQVVRAQGPLHMRALRERLAEAFGVAAEEAPVPPVYRETITRSAETHHRHRKQTGGAGQFADVKLRVAPAERGEGFLFDEQVKGGAVPRNYIPAVEEGAREAMKRGPLGFGAVDVAVTLLDGQHHAVDSSDMAFRIAARAAVAEALAQAAPVLLQPIHKVTIHAPSVFVGALSPLVSGMKGQILGFDRDPDARGWDVFRCLAPGAALDELAGALRGATQGVGRFEAEFDHYEEIYGKEADRIAEIYASASARG